MAAILTNNTTTDYYYYSEDSDDYELCSTTNVLVFIQNFIPTLYSMVFIVGFIGNGIVVCVLVKHHQRSNVTDVSLFNLAVSDLLFLFSLPFWARYGAAAEWTLGSFMCGAVTALYTLGFYGSIFFMVLMTVDRYAVIVRAQDFLFSNYRSVSASTALAVFMWALSLGASLPNIIFTQVMNNTERLVCVVEFPVGTAWRRFSYLEMNVLGWVLPLSVMAFCYSHILPILRAIKSRKKHKVVRLILIIVIVFFLFWTPYNMVIFMRFLQHWGYMVSCGWQQDLNMAMQWTKTIAYTHCCLNPIIYAFVGQKFRNLALRMLRQCFPVCFGRCTSIVSEIFERRSSLYSRSSEVSTAQVV